MRPILDLKFPLLCDLDAEEAHIVKKHKKGYVKYKGKLPFKWLNCGKVENFVAKCPYAKNESSDDEDDHNVKKGRKHHQNNHK